MGKLRFQYDPDGYGWAKLLLSDGKTDVEFLASYLGKNPLFTLMRIAFEVHQNTFDAITNLTLDFYSEPGLLRIIVLPENTELKIKVYLDDSEVEDDIDKKDGYLKLETIVSRQEFINVVVKEFERNIIKHGICGQSDEVGLRSTFNMMLMT